MKEKKCCVGLFISMKLLDLNMTIIFPGLNDDVIVCGWIC